MTTAQKFTEVGKFFVALGALMFWTAMLLLFGFIFVVFMIAIFR